MNIYNTNLSTLNPIVSPCICNRFFFLHISQLNLYEAISYAIARLCEDDQARKVSRGLLLSILFVSNPSSHLNEIDIKSIRIGYFLKGIILL